MFDKLDKMMLRRQELQGLVSDPTGGVLPGATGEDLLPRLRPAGVLGLEVWHPKHTESETRRYQRLAGRYDLLPTGGSDFHRHQPGGLLPGDVGVTLEVLAALRPLAG